MRCSARKSAIAFGDQSGIRRKAELHALARLGGFILGVPHGLREQRKIHQRLAAEESHMNGRALGRLLDEHVDRRLRHVHPHILGLSVRFADLVGAVLIAIAACQIALVGEVQHNALQREGARGHLGRVGDRIAVRDYFRLFQLQQRGFGFPALMAAALQPLH